MSRLSNILLLTSCLVFLLSPLATTAFSLRSLTDQIESHRAVHINTLMQHVPQAQHTPFHVDVQQSGLSTAGLVLIIIAAVLVVLCLIGFGGHRVYYASPMVAGPTSTTVVSQPAVVARPAAVVV